MRLDGFALLLWPGLLPKKDLKPKMFLLVVSVLVILLMIVKDTQVMIK